MISQMTPAGRQPARRARSTAASVWPVRSSTPPGLAFSGKTWPGRTMSSGPLVGSTATWIVCARSAALMPVVTPSRASIETVNAVSSAARSWQRHQLEAELVAALAASAPGRSSRRACLAMKLIVVGRDELGGHARGRPRSRGPRRRRRRPSCPPRCPRAPPRRWRMVSCSVLTLTSFSTYLASTSTSRLTGAPGCGGAEVGALERLGDERHVERVLVDARDGERDAVDRDRALLDHVAQQRRARPATVTTRAKPSSRDG